MAARYGLKSTLIKQRGICLRALEWPVMPSMESLALFWAYRDNLLDAENDRPCPGSRRGNFKATRGRLF